MTFDFRHIIIKMANKARRTKDYAKMNMAAWMADKNGGAVDYKDKTWDDRETPVLDCDHSDYQNDPY